MLCPKVKDVFNIPNYKLKNGFVGIEVEVEADDVPDIDDNFWRTEYDHSLRGNCREYVLKNPLSLGLSETALATLAHQLCDANIHDSIRAGVHIHFNMQEATILELANFQTLYYAFEEMLLSYCGDNRHGNLFCLGAMQAEYQIDYVTSAYRDNNFYSLSDDIIRYSALNLCALDKYGSVEFRALGTPQDLLEINQWVTILNSLYVASKAYSSPKEVFCAIVDDALGVFNRTFKDSETRALLEPLFVENVVEDSLELIGDFALNTDWKVFETVMIGGVHFPVGTEYPDEPIGDA